MATNSIMNQTTSVVRIAVRNSDRLLSNIVFVRSIWYLRNRYILGLSCEQSFSPTRTDEAEDFLSTDDAKVSDVKEFDLEDNSSDGNDVKIHVDEVKHEECDINDVQFDAIEYVKEEVVECEEIPISNVSSPDSDSSTLFCYVFLHRVDPNVIIFLYFCVCRFYERNICDYR